MENNFKTQLTFLIIKIDRLAAWALFFVAIIYAITGYGMTKGLIDRQMATSWHLGWLGAVGLVAFVIHTSWAIYLALKRNNIWNRLTKTSLVSFYIVMILFFGYAHFFYSGVKIAGSRLSQNTITATQSADYISDSVITAIPKTKIFTAQTLSVYNGLNGQPAYVAVDGVVYDMTDYFNGGNHYGYTAGQDLSTAFHNKHPDSFLNRLTIVGSYQTK